VHYQTAWQWAKNGTMPVPVVKTATGRYLVLEQPADQDGRTVAYCQVSSADQKTDLERQAGRVVAAATGMGLTIADVVTEVGSGLNGKRPKLARLLRDPQVSVIVVEHRDRLARFGLEHLSAALEATGRRIVVIDDTELPDDLVRDMTEVLTSLCARLYGRRSAGRRARAALQAAKDAA
jgi:Predicted site-specific integrase-resolvase